MIKHEVFVFPRSSCNLHLSTVFHLACLLGNSNLQSSCHCPSNRVLVLKLAMLFHWSRLPSVCRGCGQLKAVFVPIRYGLGWRDGEAENYYGKGRGEGTKGAQGHNGVFESNSDFKDFPFFFFIFSSCGEYITFFPSTLRNTLPTYLSSTFLSSL
jgi:hypothetical protein